MANSYASRTSSYYAHIAIQHSTREIICRTPDHEIGLALNIRRANIKSATFSFRCSELVVPMSTEHTDGCIAAKPIIVWRRLIPWLLAISSSRPWDGSSNA